MKQLRLTVGGLVQGVGYRAATRREGRRLGLRGYVRNREDGGVEIVAEGDEGQLAQLLAWARRGPPGAEVESVEESWGPPEGRFAGFDIAY